MPEVTVTIDDIRAGIQALRLSGRPIFVHSSLRSFGWVNGGPDTVIDALLAEGCTMMVPAMTWAYAVPPPAYLRPRQNAWDYDARDREWAGVTLPGTSLVYTPESNEIAKEMGAIAAAVLHRSDRMRGDHPMDSFAAVGPLAEMLLRDQRPNDPFAPFRALADVGGYALLMGVGLDRLTLVHYAEELVGRNLFMRWANGPDGAPMAVFGGDCSSGFPNLESSIGYLARDTVVGNSRWRTFPVAETLAAAAQAIRTNPWITHCPDPDCQGCHDGILGGPIY